MSDNALSMRLSLMRSEYQSLSKIFHEPASLSYDLAPVDPDQFERDSNAARQKLQSLEQSEKKIEWLDEFILPKIQGQAATEDLYQLLSSHLGQTDQETFNNYLKEKTDVKNYGSSTKDKNFSIRQIKNQQILKKYFNIDEVKKKRKLNSLHKAFIKHLKKHLDLYLKIEEDKPETIEEAYASFGNYQREFKKFSEYRKSFQLGTICQKEARKPQEQKSDKQLRAITKEVKETLKKIVDTVCLEEKRRVKEVERLEKLQKQRAIEANCTPKKKSKQNATEVNPDKEQDGAEENAKQKDSKKVEKFTPKNNMLLTSFFTKKEKSDSEAKTQQSLPGSQMQGEKNHEGVGLFYQEQSTKTENVWERIRRQNEQKQEGLSDENYSKTSEKPSIQSLRQQLRGYKMEDERIRQEPYYVNICMTLSIMEYFDFKVEPNPDIDFTEPFKKVQNVHYFEDESEYFEGEDSGQQAEDEQDSDNDEDGDNKTIVSSGHLSKEEIEDGQSSEKEDEDIKFKVEYGISEKWFYDFTREQRPRRITEGSQSGNEDSEFEQKLSKMENFTMLRARNVGDFKALPIEEVVEKTETTISPESWQKIYSEIHGFYGLKDELIRKVSNILEKTPKAWINKMIKQRTEKVQKQRFVKEVFIEELQEKIENIKEEMRNVKEAKIQELKAIEEEKNFEKNQKLEKDILECTGSRYIVNLLKQLKSKGYKLNKRELEEFINGRNGQQWQTVKKELFVMSKPLNELTKYIKPKDPQAIKIDEEVEVEAGVWNEGNIEEEKNELKNGPQRVQNSQKMVSEKNKFKKKKIHHAVEREADEKTNSDQEGQTFDPNKRRRKRTPKMRNLILQSKNESLTKKRRVANRKANQMIESVKVGFQSQQIKESKAQDESEAKIISHCENQEKLQTPNLTKESYGQQINLSDKLDANEKNDDQVLEKTGLKELDSGKITTQNEQIEENAEGNSSKGNQQIPQSEYIRIEESEI